MCGGERLLGILGSRMTRDGGVIRGGHIVLPRARIGASRRGVVSPRPRTTTLAASYSANMSSLPLLPPTTRDEGHSIRHRPPVMTRPGLRPLRPRLDDIGMPCQRRGRTFHARTHRYPWCPTATRPVRRGARTPTRISAPSPPASPLSSRSSPPARDSPRLLVLLPPAPVSRSVPGCMTSLGEGPLGGLYTGRTLP